MLYGMEGNVLADCEGTSSIPQPRSLLRLFGSD